MTIIDDVTTFVATRNNTYHLGGLNGHTSTVAAASYASFRETSSGSGTVTITTIPAMI
ncbi:hypothetical protein [uncultured Boseongicola sp.]|uniref:hypothetical protein n=1 Tax=uncultured Boseongicola sp. TaxID=1648499 RepID=UPI0026235ED1|nr:hypothetical protein [uncultured Boseongicola sp.]